MRLEGDDVHCGEYDLAMRITSFSHAESMPAYFCVTDLQVCPHWKRGGPGDPCVFLLNINGRLMLRVQYVGFVPHAALTEKFA